MAEIQGTVLSYHNIHYSVEIADPNTKCGKVKKDILIDINGLFKPGVNALLGPTGSGKTSLLDLLAGRKDPKDVTGQVLIDSRPQPDNFRLMAGYVVQDDVVMGTLTVRENLMFSANLRLPKTVKNKEKEAKVNETVLELGLTHCADTMMGTVFIRGVSGGERKRTNIGMELIISPSVLFLDEPTTGLDSSTANAVVLILHRLSKRGRTIIFSVHQPRFSIFRQFDRMTLLSLGHTVYHGPAGTALEYFRSIGYFCEEYNNPPDFFLDVINGDSSAVKGMKTSASTGYVNTGYAAASTGYVNTGYAADVGDMELGTRSERTDGEAEDVEQKLAVQLAEKYQLSPQNASLTEEINSVYDHYLKYEDSKEKSKPSTIQYQTSFFTQLLYVSKRTVINLVRDPMASMMQVGVMVLFALITGTIYFQLEASVSTGVQNRVGAFFFISMIQIFGNLSSVELFIQERAIFMHETAGGFYRVSSYFVAKLCCDVLPMRAIPVIIFSTITYFMLGLQLDVDKFFIYMLVLFMTAFSGSTLGFLISSCVDIVSIANLLMALSFVIMMMFGGFLVNTEDIVAWMRWLQYLSIFKYSLNSLAINEFKEMCFYDTDNSTVLDPDQCVPAGELYLQVQGIPYETDWDLWLNVVALAGIAVGLLVLTFIRLLLVKKVK